MVIADRSSEKSPVVWSRPTTVQCRNVPHQDELVEGYHIHNNPGITEKSIYTHEILAVLSV